MLQRSRYGKNFKERDKQKTAIGRRGVGLRLPRSFSAAEFVVRATKFASRKTQSAGERNNRQPNDHLITLTITFF